MSDISIPLSVGGSIEFVINGPKNVTLYVRTTVPPKIESHNEVVSKVKLPGLGTIFVGGKLNELDDRLPEGEISEIIIVGAKTLTVVLA